MQKAKHCRFFVAPTQTPADDTCKDKKRRRKNQWVNIVIYITSRQFLIAYFLCEESEKET